MKEKDNFWKYVTFVILLIVQFFTPKLAWLLVSDKSVSFGGGTLQVQFTGNVDTAMNMLAYANAMQAVIFILQIVLLVSILVDRYRDFKANQELKENEQ